MDKYDAQGTTNFDEGKSKNKTSLRERIFYYLAVTILLPISISVITFYFETETIVEDQIIESYQAVFDKSANKTYDFLNNKRLITVRISFDKVVQDFLLNKGIDDDIKGIVRENEFIGLERETINIYDNNNRLMFSNRTGFQEEEMKKQLFDQVKKLNRGSIWNYDRNSLNFNNINLCVPILSANTGEQPLGYIKVDIDNLVLSEIYSDLKTDTTEVFIVDANGLIISHPETENIGVKLPIKLSGESSQKIMDISSGKYLIFYKKLGSIPWYLACMYNYNEISKQGLSLLYDNIYLFIIIMLIAVTFSYVFSYNLLKIVDSINRSLGAVTIENLDKKLTDQFYFINELSILGNTFNKMTDRIEGLIEDLIDSNIHKNRLENEKKDAEIIALQSQINPHFLYNTLNTINYMMKVGSNENAITMVNAMSDLFRFGISREEIIITIREEIEYAKAYTDIMRIRYNDRIKFIWILDESLLEYKTIKLILQPIIENAIYHGISQKAGVGTIEIKCMEDEGLIKFTIRDDGVGIPAGELKEIKANLINRNVKNKIGIYNVQSRLNLYYGKAFGLYYDSAERIGTTVVISIPKT